MVKENDRIVGSYRRSKRPDKLLVYGIVLDNNVRVLEYADALLDKIPRERAVRLLEKLLVQKKPEYYASSIRYAAAHRLQKLGYEGGNPTYAARFFACTGDYEKAASYGKCAWDPIAETVFSKSGEHCGLVSLLVRLDAARAEREAASFLASSGYVYQFEKLFDAVKSDRMLKLVMEKSDFWKIKIEAFSRMSDKGPCIDRALSDPDFDLRNRALAWLSTHNPARIAKRWKEALASDASEAVRAQILSFVSDTTLLEGVLSDPSSALPVRIAAARRLLSRGTVADEARRDQLEKEVRAFDLAREREKAERSRLEEERSESLSEAYRNMEENFK